MGEKSFCNKSSFAKINVLSGSDDRYFLRDPRSSSNVTTYPGLGCMIDAAFIVFLVQLPMCLEYSDKRIDRLFSRVELLDYSEKK